MNKILVAAFVACVLVAAVSAQRDGPKNPTGGRGKTPEQPIRGTDNEKKTDKKKPEVVALPVGAAVMNRPKKNIAQVQQQQKKEEKEPIMQAAVMPQSNNGPKNTAIVPPDVVALPVGAAVLNGPKKNIAQVQQQQKKEEKEPIMQAAVMPQSNNGPKNTGIVPPSINDPKKTNTGIVPPAKPEREPVVTAADIQSLKNKFQKRP